MWNIVQYLTLMFVLQCQRRSRRVGRRRQNLASQFGPAPVVDDGLQAGGLHTEVQHVGHIRELP